MGGRAYLLDMAIYLSHTTALSIWLREGGWLVRDGVATRGGSLADSSASAREVEASGILQRGAIEAPVHVIVDTLVKRHVSRLLVPHLWSGKVPLWCFYKLSDGVFVSSPEFTVVQEVSILDRIELAWAISSLCSGFRKHSRETTLWNTGFEVATPITSLKNVERFLKFIPAEHGTSATAAALRFAVEGAASPPELALAMISCMPKRLGGYALPKPKLNQSIYLDETASRLCGKSTIYCDMLYPNKVVVEYDSDEFHAGSQALHDDRARYNALVSMGYHPIAITKNQLQNITSLDNAFRSIAIAMGKRQWNLDAYRAGQREDLLCRLLDRDGTLLEEAMGR